MTGGVAALPMYDWPEIAPATDRLWAALRDHLRAAGVAAPDALTRDRPLPERLAPTRSWCSGRPAACRWCASSPAGSR